MAKKDGDGPGSENSHWSNVGKDLVYNADISLTEALCGLDLFIEHLDGRVIHIEANPKEVIQPGDVKMVPNEGLPHQHSLMKGNLYVRLNVKLPTSLTQEQREKVEEMFPRPDRTPITERRGSGGADTKASSSSSTANKEKDEKKEEPTVTAVKAEKVKKPKGGEDKKDEKKGGFLYEMLFGGNTKGDGKHKEEDKKSK